MFLTIILLIIGFLLLIKGADLLVGGSSSLAKGFGVPDLIIGLTIVAFGTSAPELVVNLVSAFNGNTDIAVGNILGSNIVNTLLILGVASLIYPITVHRNTIFKEIPFSLLAVVILGFLVLDSKINIVDGFVLILFFVLFLIYIIFEAKKGNESSESFDIKNIGTSIFFIFLGILGLVFGGKFVVDSAVSLAQLFNLSEAVIGLTIVAIGTSLPELVTSVVAAIRGNSDIAIGNVVGSNIFNILWILGITSVVSTIPFSDQSLIDLMVVIVATTILFVFMFLGKKHTLDRWQGAFFVASYVSYIVYLLV